MPLLEQVLKKNPDTVKLVHKNYPLPNHRFARKAAAAALAAGDHNTFWAFHDELFKHYNRLSDDKIREIAQGLGLDPNAIEKAMKSQGIQGKINLDMKDAKAAGVRGTPTIFVNGRKVRNRSLQGFQNMIDAALKKHNKTPDR